MSKVKERKISEAVVDEILNIANKRTTDMFETFVGVMRQAVEAYPDGDLYEFLADQALVFVQCVVDGGMLSVGDLGRYFADCGFDDERVEVLVKTFEAVTEIKRRMDAGEQLLLWEADK